MIKDGAQETLTDTSRFLRAVFPIVDAGSLIELRAKWVNQCPAKGCYRKMCRQFFDNHKECEETALALAPVADIYVGVNTRRSDDNGKKQNLAWSGVYFAEIDAGDGKPYPDTGAIMAALDTFTPKPSLRVLSGSGVHAYWALEWPVPLATPAQVAEYETVTRGLAERLKADKGTWDASRLLRLPGTQWHKESPSREVTLL